MFMSAGCNCSNVRNEEIKEENQIEYAGNSYLRERNIEKFLSEKSGIYSFDIQTIDPVEKNGKYYLVFSIRGRARYLVSNKPFEGFEHIDNSLIPCAGVPKCAEWNGKLIFTGFEPIDGYAGTMTFKSATAKGNGKLIFENL